MLSLWDGVIFLSVDMSINRQQDLRKLEIALLQ